MKYVVLAAVVIGLCTTLGSCRKKYACTCTTLDPQGTVLNTSTTDISSGSKSKAEEKCKQLDNVMTNRTTRCFIVD